MRAQSSAEPNCGGAGALRPVRPSVDNKWIIAGAGQRIEETVLPRLKAAGKPIFTIFTIV
jgi:hypothetical protein